MPVVEDPMKILLEEFDLQVDTLFKQRLQANPSHQSWESTPLGQDSDVMDPSLLE